MPLPPTFRLRRPVLADRARKHAPASLAGTAVQVLGRNAVADAVRAMVVDRGGNLSEDQPSLVIDLGGDVLESFALARRLEPRRPHRWVTVTRLGGLLGDAHKLGSAQADGARAGFTKSLGREWDETSATVLDVHPALSAEEAATWVGDELAAPEPEIFVDQSGRRRRVELQTEAPPTLGLGVDASVVLLTGGGRGITARIADELARRHQGSGLKLALVGRSAVPSTRLDEAAAKASIRQSLQQAGERVTPAKLEAQLSPLRKGEEVRQTLERLRSYGAEVEYFRGDLASDEGTRKLVAEVTLRFGPIDVLIHGQEWRSLASSPRRVMRRSTACLTARRSADARCSRPSRPPRLR